jgi:hypothetical protein
MKPTLLFYGNCQAAALRVLFAADAAIADHYNVLHVPSFDDRIPDAVGVLPEEIAAAEIFFDQYDKAPFPRHDLLPADCLKITYPSIDLNLLWPLFCVNIFNDAPTPEFLWGHFPYGDRVVVDCVKRGLSAAQARAYYAQSSHTHLPKLERFEKLEYARLRARDARCDVKLAEYVIETFRKQNLFWAVNHPSMPALAELCHRLIDAAGDRAPVLAGAEIDATIATLHPEGPLGFIHVPVHPAIADHLGLAWYPRDGGPYYGLRDNRVSYDDYFAQMIDIAVEVRDGRAQAVGSG